MLTKVNPIDALKYGLIGLGLVLALLAYMLLAREQRKASKDRSVLPIYFFMMFSLCLMGFGLFDHTLSASPNTRSRSMPDSSFVGTWHFNGEDVPIDAAQFKPRFTYKGDLDLSVVDGDLHFAGMVDTRRANDESVLGAAQLSGEGPISDNFVAAHYDYTSNRVQGFGTAFMKFDFAGQEANAYLVFRVTTGEGVVGFVAAKLTR